MTTITIDRGSEGPRHDPYLWTEITVARTSPRFTGKVTLHTGLAEWVAIDGAPQPVEAFACGSAEELFTRLAGVTPARAMGAYVEYRERRLRFHPCGSRHIDSVSGYPGETLMVCRRCGTVLGGSFDRSAVE